MENIKVLAELKILRDRVARCAKHEQFDQPNQKRVSCQYNSRQPNAPLFVCKMFPNESTKKINK